MRAGSARYKPRVRVSQDNLGGHLPQQQPASTGHESTTTCHHPHPSSGGLDSSTATTAAAAAAAAAAGHAHLFPPGSHQAGGISSVFDANPDMELEAMMAQHAQHAQLSSHVAYAQQQQQQQPLSGGGRAPANWPQQHAQQAPGQGQGQHSPAHLAAALHLRQRLKVERYSAPGEVGGGGGGGGGAAGGGHGPSPLALNLVGHMPHLNVGMGGSASDGGGGGGGAAVLQVGGAGCGDLGAWTVRA